MSEEPPSANIILPRDEALNTVFKVGSTWEQAQGWQTEGLVPMDMPPGFFACLEPPLSSPGPDHILVGLNTSTTTPDGMTQSLQWSAWRLDDSGRIVLFFERGAEPLSIGTSVRFAEN